MYDSFDKEDLKMIDSIEDIDLEDLDEDDFDIDDDDEEY